MSIFVNMSIIISKNALKLTYNKCRILKFFLGVIPRIPLQGAGECAWMAGRWRKAEGCKGNENRHHPPASFGIKVLLYGKLL